MIESPLKRLFKQFALENIWKINIMKCLVIVPHRSKNELGEIKIMETTTEQFVILFLLSFNRIIRL